MDNNILTISEGANLISHLKESYTKWYNHLPYIEKQQTNNWKEFIKQSVKVNNENEGTEDDFIFTAEDAMHHLD